MNNSHARPKFIQFMDKSFKLISQICIILAGIALVVMTLIFAWLVFGRYVLNDTPTWVEQVSLLLVMLIAFLGSAVGVHENTHLSVAIFRIISPRWLRNAFVVISDVIMAIFGALMLWYGAALTMFKWTSLIPLIQVPEGYRSLPLTISGGLLLLFSIGHLIRFFYGVDERTDSIE